MRRDIGVDPQTTRIALRCMGLVALACLSASACGSTPLEALDEAMPAPTTQAVVAATPEPLAVPLSYADELELTDSQELLLDEIDETATCAADHGLSAPTGNDVLIEVLRVIDGCLVFSSEPVDAEALEDRTREIRMEQGVLAVGQPTVALDFSITPDPLEGEQWFLDDLRVAELDELSINAADPVKVAIMEGNLVDFSHRDLSETPNGLAPWALEVAATDGHATHVAGIVAGTAGNGELGRGIAQYVELISVPVGNGPDRETRSVAAAIGWATRTGVQIINMSFCEAFFHSPDEASLQNPDDGACITRPNESTQLAIEAARRAGVIMIAAVGNCGANHDRFVYQCGRELGESRHRPSWPASYTGVLGVGAHDQDGSRTATSSANSSVDVSAPGGEIRSLWSPSPEVESLSGTSMAAPMVTGVVAVFLAHRPDINPRRFVSGLIGFARDVGEPGRDDEFGFGMIDPMRVVEEINAAEPFQPEQPTGETPEAFPDLSDLVGQRLEDPFYDAGIFTLEPGQFPGPLGARSYQATQEYAAAPERLAFYWTDLNDTAELGQGDLALNAYVEFYGGDKIPNALVVYRYDPDAQVWRVLRTIDADEIGEELRDEPSYAVAIDGVDVVGVNLVIDGLNTRDQPHSFSGQFGVSDFFDESGGGYVWSATVACTFDPGLRCGVVEVAGSGPGDGRSSPEDEPSIWCVTGVASDDVLNLRSAAGTGNPVVFEIPYDSCSIRAPRSPASTAVGDATWYQVRYEDHAFVTDGWLNSRFVSYQGPDRCALGDEDFCEL